jgi:hypothetical protein
MSSDVYEKIYKINPKSVVYLFSGGKDSSLALLLTRDFIRNLCMEIKCKVYVVYIYVTGNTHPLNNACVHFIMQWHKRNYGFEPIYLASSKNFLEYLSRYGLEILKGRWCYTEFKYKPLVDFESMLPKPVVEIDGMSPSDSMIRREILKAEFHEVRSERRHYWAWHPLFSLNISSKEKLEMLKQYKEFECVVQLYEIFEDSMNCVICPYKSKEKLMKLTAVEPSEIYYNALEVSLKSSRWKKKFRLLKSSESLEKYLVNTA